MLKTRHIRRRERSRERDVHRLLKGGRLTYIVLSVCLIFLGVLLLRSRNSQDSIVQKVYAAPYINPTCVYRGEIESGQSLSLALTGAGISARIVHDINLGLRDIFNPRHIRPGDKFSICFCPVGETMNFTLERSQWESYKVVKTPDTLYGVKDSTVLEYNLVGAKGTVENTLWQSMRNAGMSPRLIMNFTDLLSYDFCFVTSTRNGQKFRVLYEQYSYGGEPVQIGRILFAEYEELSGSKHIACLFEVPGGEEGYYNLAGKSVKRSLLRTPLNYTRISSGFTHARMHPIHRVVRPHLGVDFAAPTGTPVIASGSGTVITVAWIGGYGKSVRIRHANNIETQYHHLSRYAKGIREGVRVREGQLIGYVGATGTATGPHLDYRVKVHGKYVNPLTYAFPSGPPVPSKYMTEYLDRAKNIEKLAYALTSVADIEIAEIESKDEDNVN